MTDRLSSYGEAVRRGIRAQSREAKIASQILLTHVGAHCPASVIHHLDAALGYLETGRWMRERAFNDPVRYRESHDLWAAVADEIADEKVLYLEFGVWTGNSIRNWSRLLRNPQTILHGFDSFVGLPDNWTPVMRAGVFSTAGHVPAVADPRIRFFKGWFHETLPTYEWPESYDRLVVNLDADLYAPTAFVLDWLRDRIIPGTLLYFDQFCDHEHELRAFSEFLDKTGMQFRVRGARRELGSVLFERVVD